MTIAKTRPAAAPLQPLLPQVRPVQEIDLPKSLFLDHSGARLHIDWKAVCGAYPGGVYEVPLDPATKATFLDVTQFRRINVRVSGTQATPALYIGKFAGSTCAERNPIPLDDRIHSFEVTGPQIHIELSGSPALGVEDVQLWVYLRS
jgi:hypothetical protein